MQLTSFPPLSEYEKNTFSQYGEDGVVKELLRRISEMEPLNNWCVEFGAWDGLHLSNTARLIREENYSAVFIEGNPKKHRELCRNFPETNIIKICEFVNFEGPTSLENILLKAEIPTDLDFLSIDIDGNDYHILKSLSVIKPKVICIEFNAMIPNEVEYVQEPDFQINVGSSGRSIAKLGREKGYVLAYATLGNLFLVREDLSDSVLGSDRPKLEDLVNDSEIRNFVFVGFDGSLVTSKPVWMPWHKLRVTPQGLQALPKYLIRFPSDYNLLQRIFFFAYRAFSESVKKEKR